MTIYYVYQYVRNDQTPYYIGKGTKRRAWETHRRANGCDLRPRDRSKIQIIKSNLTEQEAWDLETSLIAKYGKHTDGGILVNVSEGGVGGKTVSSESRMGKKNPMYGKANPCSNDKRLQILYTKNAPNYELYKQAITLIDAGKSACSVSKELGIGKGVCCRLKNRTHGFFEAFPEFI
jgi:hypothetical protein